MNKPRVISLFSGGGGLDLGLAAAGFDILFENDIDQASCNTLDLNGKKAKGFGLSGFEHAVVQCGDIREIDGSEILKQANCKAGEIDVLAGGPPCQAFSVFGKRRGTVDQRGQLSFEYKRVLGQISPKVFIFENVAGLLTVEKGETYNRLLQELSEPADGLEYKIFANRVDAHDYCVPQNRDRVIIVGIRSDIAASRGLDSFHIDELSSSDPKDTKLVPWRTVSDAFRGLPELGPNEPPSTLVFNHHGRKHSDQIIERYDRLGPGERDGKTRINRLYLDRPSYTIVVGSDKGGGKGHVHPTHPREVTPRESARIQTFPDWWEFTGSVRDEIRQIGNAVPTLLGYSIGNSLRTKVFGLDSVSLNEAAKRLGQSHLFV